MYCPQCGQQISDELHFCPRCGFALDGVAKIIAAGGTLPELDENVSSRSPRRRGIEQGAIDAYRDGFAAINKCRHQPTLQ